VEAHVAEEEARVPRDPLELPQETRGDDAVGVDVGKIDRRGDRGEAREGLHQSALDAATDAWQDKWHEPTGAKFPPSPSGADVPPPSRCSSTSKPTSHGGRSVRHRELAPSTEEGRTPRSDRHVCRRGSRKSR